MRTRLVLAFVLVVGLLSAACSSGDGNSPPPTGPTPPPTPPPQLSAKAKGMIQEWNIDWIGRGGTVRWPSLPVSVWADVNFPNDSLQKAVDFWNTRLPGTQVVRLVQTEKEADFSLSSVFPPPYEIMSPELLSVSCGVGGPRTFRGNMVASAAGAFAFLTKAPCTLGDNLALTIAHEMGHGLAPYGGHTDDGGILGKPSTWDLGPSLTEVFIYLYSVPPGTRLE